MNNSKLHCVRRQKEPHNYITSIFFVSPKKEYNRISIIRMIKELTVWCELSGVQNKIIKKRINASKYVLKNVYNVVNMKTTQ